MTRFFLFEKYKIYKNQKNIVDIVGIVEKIDLFFYQGNRTLPFITKNQQKNRTYNPLIPQRKITIQIFRIAYDQAIVSNSIIQLFSFAMEMPLIIDLSKTEQPYT